MFFVLVYNSNPDHFQAHTVVHTNVKGGLGWKYSLIVCEAEQRGWWIAWGTVGTADTPVRSEGTEQRVSAHFHKLIQACKFIFVPCYKIRVLKAAGLFPHGHKLNTTKLKKWPWRQKQYTSCSAVALWPVTSLHMMMCSSRMTWKVERMGLQSNTETWEIQIKKRTQTSGAKCSKSAAPHFIVVHGEKHRNKLGNSLFSFSSCIRALSVYFWAFSK